MPLSPSVPRPLHFSAASPKNSPLFGSSSESQVQLPVGYRFADHTEPVIALLARVCTVSLETMKIVRAMP